MVGDAALASRWRHRDSHGATDYGGPMADAVEHKGWLQKQGHVNKDFKRRYFVLKGAKLSYYEDVAGYNRNKSKGSVTVTVSYTHLRAHETPEHRG